MTFLLLCDNNGNQDLAIRATREMIVVYMVIDFLMYYVCVCRYLYLILAICRNIPYKMFNVHF